MVKYGNHKQKGDWQMKADTVFKEKERPFEAEAIISSLLIALEAPIYPSSIKRLQGAITAVQNEPFVIVHDRNNVFFYGCQPPCRYVFCSYDLCIFVMGVSPEPCGLSK